MLLQPFVENSIIHGVSGKKNGLILISIKKEHELIRCIVQDNGIGRKVSTLIEGKPKTHQSLALKITQERLHIINKLKKSKASINIFDLKDTESKSSGLKVELILPFETTF